MKYHADTTFVVDWHHESSSISVIQDEILDGIHDITLDPIMEAEYFAVRHLERRKEIAFASLAAIATPVPVTSESARLAAKWLGQMDVKQKRRHFNDAMIAAIAQTTGATLLTGDKRTVRVLPVEVRQYQ